MQKKEKYSKSAIQKTKITLKAGIVAAIGLILVYGGLTYLGATVSKVYGQDVVQTSLIVQITASLLGNTGKIILAIIVMLACLTTAIGLTSATAQFFEKTTNGKLKYGLIVTVVCIFSAIVSNFGVSTIITFSGPILDIIYPATVVLIIMNLFANRIKNNNIFKGATYTALLVSVVTILNNMGVINIPFINKLPLSSIGFNWVLPVLIGAIIGSFIKKPDDKGKDLKIKKIG